MESDHDLLIQLYHRDPRPEWWPAKLSVHPTKHAGEWMWYWNDFFIVPWQAALAIARDAATVWLMEHTRNRGGFFLLAPTDSADVYHISIGAGVGVEAPTILSALAAACEAEVKHEG